MTESEFPERFNMADYFLDARIREGKGDRIAVRVGDRRWTYREVQELADRCSHALRDRGIDYEDRVLILLFD
ncbi:MAG TPA: AMP-binding protein, partial [Sandaracinaceae bacterium]